MGWLRRRMDKSMAKFVERRLPTQQSITLDQSRIFIVPTRQGLLLLGVAALTLLMAINFDSALNYALTFWLIAMLWVAVHLTYRNLSGLTIEGNAGNLVCVGDIAEITLTLKSAKPLNRGVIELIHEDWGSVHVVMNASDTHAILPIPTYTRGPIAPPRFRIESRYPFGLVVAWTNISLDAKAWVYPEARAYDRVSDMADGDEEELSLNDHFFKPGSEDFHSLKDYAPGDSIKRMHWPAFSRDHLLVKTFSDYQSSDEVIDWEQFPGVPDELRLSAIAHYSEQFHQANAPFGVRMPGHDIEPDKGSDHLTRVRRLLAEYGYE